jgi:hypothetical protein
MSLIVLTLYFLLLVDPVTGKERFHVVPQPAVPNPATAEGQRGLALLHA